MKNRLLLIIMLALLAPLAMWGQKNLPYEYGFENNNYTAEGWTFINEQGISEQATYGMIRKNNSHTGSYCFRMKGAGLAYSYLISPELLGTENGVYVDFYYKISSSETPSEFRVGYSMTTNDPYDFTWGELNYIDLTGYKEYVNTFPSNVKYVAVAMPINTSFLFVDDFSFTEAQCAMPTIPSATPTSNSIGLSWTGSGSSYDLRYASFYPNDFNESLGDWMPSFGTSSWEWNSNALYSYSGTGSAISDVNASHPANYLVSPLVPLGDSMTFFAQGIKIEGSGSFKSSNPQYNFKVMVSTVENPTTVSDFTQVGAVMTATENVWNKYKVDLSGFSGTGHVAICHIYNGKGFGDPEPPEYKFAVDDITIYSPWEQVAVNGTSYTIGNTNPATCYSIQLKGVCSECCDQWTDVLMVLTPPTSLPETYEFVQNGSWNMVENWKYWLMPPTDGNVTIKANARIPAGYVAEVGEITLNSNPAGSITIADGGQLKQNNSVVATMEKFITGYTGEKDHYKLLAFPTDGVVTIDDNHLKDFGLKVNDNVTYDFYMFDQNEELEWVNYEQPLPTPEPGYEPQPWYPFTTLTNGTGYLYSRASSKTIKFISNGDLIGNSDGIKPSNVDVSVPLTYMPCVGFAGWNLIGNPFACNAYLSNSRPFYRLVETADGSILMLASSENGGNVIAPMEGIFVQAVSSGEQATFTSNEPRNNRDGGMDFTLSKANTKSVATIDRTRVVFGEGSDMSHLDLMADPNRLYFPIDDKAMAVIYAQSVGELPLNFEVATEGSFVLGFESRVEGLVYCHLIDNLTGADIDLLQQPEYTFDARKKDYVSRFRVVFAKADNSNNGVENDEFAYLFNGNIIVANEGHAVLQVIDVQGRILMSETIEGNACSNINVAPGVYILRLINGNDVKTQKIVVR